MRKGKNGARRIAALICSVALAATLLPAQVLAADEATLPDQQVQVDALEADGTGNSTENGTNVEPGTDTEAGTVKDNGSGQTDTETGAGEEAGSGTETDADTEGSTDKETGTGAEAGTDTGSSTDTEGATDAETDTDTEGSTDAETNIDAEAVTMPKETWKTAPAPRRKVLTKAPTPVMKEARSAVTTRNTITAANPLN